MSNHCYLCSLDTQNWDKYSQIGRTGKIAPSEYNLQSEVYCNWQNMASQITSYPMMMMVVDVVQMRSFILDNILMIVQKFWAKTITAVSALAVPAVSLRTRMKNIKQQLTKTVVSEISIQVGNEGKLKSLKRQIKVTRRR